MFVYLFIYITFSSYMFRRLTTILKEDLRNTSGCSQLADMYIDLKEILCVDWIEVTQGRDQGRIIYQVNEASGS